MDRLIGKSGPVDKEKVDELHRKREPIKENSGPVAQVNSFLCNRSTLIGPLFLDNWTTFAFNLSTFSVTGPLFPSTNAMISKGQALCMLYCEEFNQENVDKYTKLLDERPDLVLCYGEDETDPVLITKRKLYANPFKYHPYPEQAPQPVRTTDTRTSLSKFYSEFSRLCQEFNALI